MRIAVVHTALSPESPADEQDALVQAEAVRAVLQTIGHEAVIMTCGLDLAAVRDELVAWRADLVFNLVESLDGRGRLIHLFPCLLDAVALPYTGASAEAQFMTSNKLLAKQRMQAAGLPTPPWSAPRRGAKALPPSGGAAETGRWIIKSVWEHASIGLDAGAILDSPAPGKLAEALKARAARLGGSCFAEVFIDGREFNLSLLDAPDGPQVLQPAEIIFEGFSEDQARIVDYSAKWDEASFAYHHTPRRFAFESRDEPLLARLRALALECWHCFELSGYARVDFRVDSSGRPWVLEINTNPCLSPDAGFAAAVNQSGLLFEQAIERIVAAAL